MLLSPPGLETGIEFSKKQKVPSDTEWKELFIINSCFIRISEEELLTKGKVEFRDVFSYFAFIFGRRIKDSVCIE